MRFAFPIAGWRLRWGLAVVVFWELCVMVIRKEQKRRKKTKLGTRIAVVSQMLEVSEIQRQLIIQCQDKAGESISAGTRLE